MLNKAHAEIRGAVMSSNVRPSASFKKLRGKKAIKKRAIISTSALLVIHVVLVDVFL